MAYESIDLPTPGQLIRRQEPEDWQNLSDRAVIWKAAIRAVCDYQAGHPELVKRCGNYGNLRGWSVSTEPPHGLQPDIIYLNTSHDGEEYTVSRTLILRGPSAPVDLSYRLWVDDGTETDLIISEGNKWCDESPSESIKLLADAIRRQTSQRPKHEPAVHNQTNIAANETIWKLGDLMAERRVSVADSERERLEAICRRVQYEQYEVGQAKTWRKIIMRMITQTHPDVAPGSDDLCKTLTNLLSELDKSAS